MPNNEQLILKATEKIAADQLEEAAELLEDVLQDDPKNDEAWMVASRLFEDPHKQLEYVNNALEANPANDEAIRRAWELQQESEEFEQDAGRRTFFFRLIDRAFWLGLGACVIWAVIIFSNRQSSLLPVQPVQPAQPTLFAKQTLLEDRNSRRLSSRLDEANPTFAPSMSADGNFIAFQDFATRIFLYDVQQRRSIAITKPDEANAGAPAISSDGRFVVFEQRNLVRTTAGEPAELNLYVYDRVTNETSLVSTTHLGDPINSTVDETFAPAISADGEVIVYQSGASNIVPNDTNSKIDIFVIDRRSNTTEQVSVNAKGEQANGDSNNPAISSENINIVYTSVATNLDNSAQTGDRQIYMYRLDLKENSLISKNSAGEAGTGDSDYAAISDDGNQIAFLTMADNLGGDNHEGMLDVVVFNRSDNRMNFVSVSFDAAELSMAPSIDHTHLAMSANGRFVIYGQSWRFLDSLDPEAVVEGVFVFDQQMGATNYFAMPSRGLITRALDPTISDDGQTLAFISLQPGYLHFNILSDLYLHKTGWRTELN